MILIVDKSRKNANSIVDISKYMGILARAETPDTALSEISLFYRAVLVVNPYNLPDCEEFIAKLRSYAGEIPIFAISDKKYAKPLLFNMTFDSGITSSKLYRLMVNYCEERKLIPIGEYKLAGIDASAEIGRVTYFSEPIPFTKTESMIIRLLAKTYPAPMSPKSILKYAFTQSMLPDVSGIRTHISGINKKFRAIAGRNLIFLKEGEGYLILTPEILNKNKKETVSAIN